MHATGPRSSSTSSIATTTSYGCLKRNKCADTRSAMFSWLGQAHESRRLRLVSRAGRWRMRSKPLQLTSASTTRHGPAS
ncbi:hypothetical protein ACFPRL_17425 [Pseudoclavibacter helvolus]